MILDKILQLDEVEQFHSINTIICIFDSVDNAIHFNDANEFKNEFLSIEDLNDALKQSTGYNPKHNYFTHHEYKKLKSSNCIFDLVDKEQLEQLIKEYSKQINEMQLL